MMTMMMICDEPTLMEAMSAMVKEEVVVVEAEG